MARVKEVIMGQQAFATGHAAPMLDISKGGQFGWAPNLTEWISNQAYMRNNLICILLEAPAFFQIMPEPQRWVDALKALVEQHPRSIEGFNGGLTVEIDEHPVGGAGEMQQEFTDVKRARSEPSFTYVEKYGMPIQTLLYNWITYGLMDPDTKFALVGTLNANVPEDMLADWYSMSCLFMEPDPTHRKVVKSWVTTNMWPKATGEIIGKRDMTSARELTNLTIEFTGLSQFSLGTNVFAQSILDKINITNANPNLRRSFIETLHADVTNNAAVGYASTVTAVSANTVAPV